MGDRPVRQYYDGVVLDVEDVGDPREPWVRHRRRLLEQLGTLDDEQWHATTRCTEWDARGAVSHLVTVDQFWVLTLGNARDRQAPTTFLREFDPSTATEALVGPLLELSPAELLERFSASTDALVDLVGAFDADDWASLGESPFGHIPARYLVGHAFWDSWLHERDVFVPLGLAPPVERDELLHVAWFSLLVTGFQGGLLDDAEAVGPGPAAAIDVALRFDELPDDPFHLRVDDGVHLHRPNGVTPVTAGSAVALVETVTGRRPMTAVAALPADVVEQIERAVKIL